MSLVNGVLERLGIATTAPGVGSEIQSDRRRIGSCFTQVRNGTAAGEIEALQRDERHCPADTRHTIAVVADATDGPSAVCAVIHLVYGVVIHRIVVVVHEIPTARVIDVAIAVVIDPVARDFARIRPHVGR